MRPKRRNAPFPPVSLFDLPPRLPSPGPDALEATRNLLKRLFLRLAEPPAVVDTDAPPSGLDNQGQDARRQVVCPLCRKG